MASIFTYDPEPPRVASPWLTPLPARPSEPDDMRAAFSPSPTSSNGRPPQRPTRPANASITRLQAEPQEGPVEYKLHLLLRPRRKFRHISTTATVSGSRHPRPGGANSARSASEHSVEPLVSPDSRAASLASTLQTRQHRLEQLTTQLLWRLQQSSPHHTSSATNIILPSLPEALPELKAPAQPAALLHGLEESEGALYEIGVSDDGTLVGLAGDEMQESLTNLRAMAACLGCTVDVLREEVVGECEWCEEAACDGGEGVVWRSGALLVVEAMVKPCLQTASVSVADAASSPPTQGRLTVQNTEQLRITLTGPTTSGKSTLLGTLAMSATDNGKGKSRLSMLKHRHEITSGITSSVTQELIGYRDSSDDGVEVVNYATQNIDSWIDVHAAARDNRLVLISDSAGHPRYRRTTIRGLVGWDPHYTLLCVPADDTEDTVGRNGGTHASQQPLSSAVSDMDLSSAQIELCLRLNVPLVVVVTKLDLASRAGLKGTLTKILDALKAYGRKPAILPHSQSENVEDGLQTISSSTIETAYHAALPLLNSTRETVPIVLTSAVRGTGISNLHALLHELPIPLPPQETDVGVVFHVEDTFHKPSEADGLIVWGRLRCGRLCVGDTGVVGPFSVQEWDDSEDSDGRPRKTATSQIPTSRSFPGALRSAHLHSPLFHASGQEWRRFKVVSIRNLRLPVHALETDQVGTAAIVPDDAGTPVAGPAPFARIRKGMVLCSVQRPATRTFAAEFARDDLAALAVGSHVVVYIASVRASARVVSARAPDSPRTMAERSDDDDDDDDEDDGLEVDAPVQPFGFDPEPVDAQSHRRRRRPERRLSERVAGGITASTLLVTLHFDGSKEFVVVGDKVLVMPGGGPGFYGGSERGEKGLAGLDGFVGRVTDTYG